jgi:hypothetical protein
MKPARWLTGCATVAVVMGVCRVACANSISPYVWFWPGVVSIYLAYAFPASLLAAFVERPFLTAGGIDRRALVVSLRANFLSAVIGLLLFPIGEPALYAIGPLWCLMAFGISCIVEIVYVRRFSEEFRWGWAVGGNAASSFLLMIIPPFTLALKQSHPELAWSLKPYEMSMVWWSLGLSVGVFLLSFAWPVPRGKLRTSAVQSQSLQQESTVPAGHVAELTREPVIDAMHSKAIV